MTIALKTLADALRSVALGSVVLAAMVLRPDASWAQENRHDRILVVPAPKGVVIDGDLKDWDLSAAVDSALDEKLRPLFSVRMAAMYDADALYIGAHYVDDTPMINRHDPQIDGDVGWSGDSLQLHLCSDTGQTYPLGNMDMPTVCTLLMWHYTDKQQPVLWIGSGSPMGPAQVRKTYVGKDSGVAFKMDADKKGYTLESRIPWSRLHAPKPPKAGQRIALIAQPFWGDATGLKHAAFFYDFARHGGFAYSDCGMWGAADFLAKGHLPAIARPRTAAQRRLPMTTTLQLPDPKATTVSAAIYNSSNVMVRTLLAGTAAQPVDQPLYGSRIAKRTGGTVDVAWDGLDDAGKPLPAGDYSLKVLTSQGVGQRWVTSLNNAGNPPWFTDDGTGSWGGDHAPPVAVAADDNRVYLLWSMSECGPGLIACRPDGQKLWGAVPVTMEAGWGFNAAAVEGDYVYTLQDGAAYGEEQGTCKPAIARFEAATGKPAGFAFGKRCLFVGNWSNSLMLPGCQRNDHLWNGDYGALVYNTFHSRYKRTWERLKTHDFGPQEMGRNAMGLAVRANTAYVTKYLENKVASFDLTTGKQLKEWSVARPVGIAAAADGTIYATSARSIVKLLPDGGVASVVQGVLSNPWGLTVGKDGLLYASDCGDAMQVKVFDTTGKLVRTIGKKGGRAWLGKYDESAMLEPAGLAFDRDNKLWVAEYDLSPPRISTWDANGMFRKEFLGPGTYAVQASVDAQRPNLVCVHNVWFDVNYQTGAAKPVGTFQRAVRGPQIRPDRHQYQFVHVRGQTYAVSQDNSGAVVFLVKDDKDGVPVAEPVAAWGGLGLMGANDLWPEDFPAAIRSQARAEIDAKQWYRTAYQWHDLNGDRLIQDNEWTFTPVEQTKCKSSLGFYWGSPVDDRMTFWLAGGDRQITLPVKEWKGVVPIFASFAEIEPSFSFGKKGSGMTIPDGDSLYSSAAGVFAGGVFGYAAEKRRLNGDVIWAYKRATVGLNSPLPAEGDMPCIGLRTMTKTPEGSTFLFFNAYFGQYFLLDGDGLFVGVLCKDTRTGPKCDSNTILKENFNGTFFRNKENGKYYAIGGDIDARIWEVTGIDTLRKVTVSLSIRPEDAERSAVAAREAKGNDSSGQTSLRIGKAPAGFKPESLSAWDMTKAVTWDAGLGRTAKVALAHDATNLYAVYQVADQSPMVNAGKDWTSLFQYGDTCEIMLGADPGADPKRSRPAPGDMRILFGVMEGRPIAGMCEAVARPGEQKAPRAYVSLTGAENFERVVPLTSAVVKVTRTADGYTLSATVPLKDIGFAPTAGLETKGDVGVLFSDDGGTHTAVRTYYFNHNTGITGDLPSEARLQPADWGTVEVTE